MNNEHIKIKRNDLRLLMLAGFRYSLGRRTYMPDTLTKLIKNNSKIFNKQDWKQFIRDIEFQKDLKNLGDECDIETWNSFKEFCKNKIHNQEN